MAFEPVYDTAVFDTYRRLGTGQAVVEARLLPRPETRIAKVLSTSSQISIGAAEAFTGEARYSGRVNFKVLFETTEGGVEMLDYNADFSDKIEANGVGAATKTCFSASILDMDIIAAEEDVVKLAAVVEVTLYGCDRENIKYLARGGESVYTREDRVKCCNLVAEANDTFIVSDTVTDLNGCEIIATEAEAFVSRIDSFDESVAITGETVATLVLRSQSGALSSKRIYIPIDWQCRADGARAGDITTGGICVKNVSVSMSGGGEETVAELELTLKADVLVFRTDEITPSIDAFCLENELLSTVQSVEISMPKGDVTITDTVEGNVAIDEKLPLADAISGVFGSRVSISNVLSGDGRVTVEGMLGCNIVYVNTERGSNTVFAQVPFSLALNADGVEEGDFVTAVAGVKDVNVKIRRGNELSLRGDICIRLTPVKTGVSAIISEIKVGETKQPREAAISVHIARKGETVWDAAKALGLTPEEVTRQNPDVAMPCAGGERLVAYRQMEKKAK